MKKMESSTGKISTRNYFIVVTVVLYRIAIMESTMIMIFNYDSNGSLIVNLQVD